MLLGEYSHSIDAKGRVIVPAKFREELGEGFVVSKGLDGNLYVFPQEAWLDIEQKLRAAPITSPAARKVNMFFHSGTSQPEIDKQGRINLTPVQRSHADLKKDVVIIGMGSRVDIWDRERWEKMNSYDDIGEAAEKLAELGIQI